ncbi:ribonuclease Y [Candidatus Roizmanbacteria bacterium]|nr:ribonuclease Y [Candidatus Roizmanbacteria bacterium]
MFDLKKQKPRQHPHEQPDEQARKTIEEALEIEKRIAETEKHIEERERALKEESQRTQRLQKELEEQREKLLKKLEAVSKMSQDELKRELLSLWEDKMQSEIAKRIRQSEEEIQAKTQEKAKEILLDAMRHGATDYVAEYTLTTVTLPSEDFKGRIIGKDGRNIRAFELATGIDVDLEEEGVIKLSSFDAVKREIARVSLEQLIKDGRIQPQRIEEVVVKTKKEIERSIFQAGEELAHRVGVYNLPNEILTALGKFKYRYSYGQNMIIHTLEETKIGVALAHELKCDVDVVRLGCLFHDIGKVITDKEGSHVELGVEFLKKHGFPQKVIGCVASHHEDIPFPSVEAVIVYIADAVSGGRPGARHEDFDQYLKRIKTIEDVAKTKQGVREAYALQAGRELRVIVKPEEITDDEATVLAQKIKEELEQKFDVFPGQIKVTIIREFRAEETTQI